MIEVESLSRRFGNTLALDRVSFSVGEGEIVGFLGPNGAGKSTAMKILTCSLAPSAGHARIAGFDITTDAIAVRQQVGFMPENVPLYPDNGVHELLRFVAELKGVPRAEREDHLTRIERLAGLSEVRHRLVGNLSKGFRQRVGLAQALVGDPPVLILDEPTSGLDPHQIVEIRELIQSFQGQKTVLLSSHILSEVSRTCERVLILDHGRLVTEERPDVLAAQPAAKQRVKLSWDGDRGAVTAALAEVAGVDEVVGTEDGAEVVLAGNPIEIRPRLVESVVNAGGKLQHMEDREPSLEELFLRLTSYADESTDESPHDSARERTDPSQPPGGTS